MFTKALNTAKVDLVMTQYNQVMVNSFYAFNIGGWAPASLTQLASVVDVWWDGYYADHCSGTVALTKIRARDLSAEDSAVVEYTPLASTVGALVGSAMPGNVTATVKFRTGFAGKRKRGRVYMVGLQENQVLDNALETGQAAALVGVWEALAEALDQIETTHVVVSRYLNFVQQEYATVTPVISYGCDGFIRSQRRRLTGVGT